MSTTVSRPEAQARRLLAAYPWRMRAEQGDEIVATVLDTLPVGATRLPWRTAVDLVRGGLRTRRQRRPPFLTWLAFDVGFVIHPRWIWWVFDKLEDPNYRRNSFLMRAVGPGLTYGTMTVLLNGVTVLLNGGGRSFLGLMALFATGLLPWLGVATALEAGFRVIERDRERRRARYGLLPGGSDPRMVWIRTVQKPLWPGGKPRVSVHPVARQTLSWYPGAEVWTPELDASAPDGERPPDPAS